MSFEENEISVNSNGGTELSKRSLAHLIPAELQEEFQIVCSRVRELQKDKIRVYWAHDLPEDPICNVNWADFHKIVFVSNWQMQQFVQRFNLPWDAKLEVIENPVEPGAILGPKPKDVINLVYFSTPQRGLEILVPVFEELVKHYPQLHLHVHSSFAIYGWHDSDAHYEALYKRIAAHPNMTYHGFTPASEMRLRLREYHILAYPSIWKETSCRVLIEAMTEGLLCVHPNLAALPETAGGLTTMYQYQDNVQIHANLFYRYLSHAVDQIVSDDQNLPNWLNFVKAATDSRFNTNKIAARWEGMMTQLASEYLPGKRDTQQEVWTYRSS